jgi:hypothetical protein
METCYRCEINLTDEILSEEHVIPNSCGGRLTSNKLLCKACNSFFGEKFDKIFAEQTNFLANILNIKRDRGRPQNIKGVYVYSGEPAVLRPNGSHGISRPIVKKSYEEDQAKVYIKARNDSEFEQILISLKRKYPKIDIAEIMTNSTIQKSNEPIAMVIKFSIESKRSIVKSLVNYFLIKEGDKKYIKHLIPYIEGQVDYNDVYVHYPDIPIYEPGSEEVSNVIKIVGNPSEKLLYGYIEIFNVHNYLTILNNDYDGPPMNLTYIHDVLLNERIVATIDINYNKQFLKDLFSAKNETPFLNFQKVFQRVINIAMNRLHTKNIQDIISDIVLTNFPFNSNLTELPKELEYQIEKRISELQPITFKFGMPTLGAPPINEEERNLWLQDKTKTWFKKGSH